MDADPKPAPGPCRARRESKTQRIARIRDQLRRDTYPLDFDNLAARIVDEEVVRLDADCPPRRRR